MREEVLKKHKIEVFYKYGEIRKGDTIQFGWLHASKNEVSEPVIVSTGSSSSKLTDSDLANSKTPPTAQSVKDMTKFIEGLLKSYFDDIKTIDDFWNRFGKSQEEWNRIADSKNISQYAKEVTWNTIALIKGEIPRYTMMGRVYKVVE